MGGSGIYFPLPQLPEWLQPVGKACVAEMNPTYAVQLGDAVLLLQGWAYWSLTVVTAARRVASAWSLLPLRWMDGHSSPFNPDAWGALWQPSAAAAIIR